jgi:hypothetical protein
LSGNAKLDGGILTQCIKNFGKFNFEGSEIEPSCADYCLHFVICITHEFAKHKNSILNKSYNYMKIYYEILNLVLNKAETGLKTFADLEEYQIKLIEAQ